MELRHLRYFVAVADEGSFGRASRRLNVSQQGLSKQVRELERELGVTLLERRADGVGVTTAGAALLADARRMLLDAAQAAERAQAAAGAPRARLVVASVELGFRGGLVPAAVRAHRAAHPNDVIAVRHLASLAQWDALRARTLDVGVVYTAPPADDAGLAAEPLLDDPLATALVPPGHAAARQAASGAVPLRAMRDLPLVLFPRTVNPDYHDRLFAQFRAAQFTPREVVEAADGPCAWGLVRAGVGWALEPASYASAPPDGTAAVRLADFALPFGLWLLLRRDEQAPAVHAFAAALRGARDTSASNGAVPAGNAARVAAPYANPSAVERGAEASGRIYGEFGVGSGR